MKKQFISLFFTAITLLSCLNSLEPRLLIQLYAHQIEDVCCETSESDDDSCCEKECSCPLPPVSRSSSSPNFTTSVFAVEVPSSIQFKAKTIQQFWLDKAFFFEAFPPISFNPWRVLQVPQKLLDRVVLWACFRE